MELIAVILLVLLVLFGEGWDCTAGGDWKGCPIAVTFRKQNAPRANLCNLWKLLPMTKHCRCRGSRQN